MMTFYPNNFKTTCAHTMTERFFNKVADFNGGLYLIGQTAINPHTEECFYWAKVGQTGNAKSRFGSYQTDNPCVFYIDLHTTIVFRDEQENACINKLASIAYQQHRAEWFRISKEDYLNICEQGFKYFESCVYGKVTSG